ncbi:MAG: Gfo/Idh/MocA family oxidoreductase [Enterocloster asparagiformis]|nr:Gfo/Idh/MocA family oxidoreductase [Enterocloster asparagiformis]
MDRKVRWGILGYAGIARNHVIPAMAKAENAELSAIASRSRDKLKEAVAQFGFRKVYESYDRLLEDPEIDAVYIPLPNALHKEWAVKAARHGKHVLCEKPLALTEADCRELEAVFKENHVKLMEAFMYRFLPGIRALKEALEQGAVGEIRHIYSTHRFYLQNNGDVRVNQELGGGCLRDVGCYPVNLIGWLTDDYPQCVSAEKTMFQGVEHALAASLKYKNGVTANISCGFDGCSSMVTEINGTKGSILVRDTFIDTTKPILLTSADGRTEEILVEDSDCYMLEVEEFSDAVLKNREPALGLEETIRNCRLIEAILKAAE